MDFLLGPLQCPKNGMYKQRATRIPSNNFNIVNVSGNAYKSGGLGGHYFSNLTTMSVISME